MDGIRSHRRIGKLGNKANCIDNFDNAIKKESKHDEGASSTNGYNKYRQVLGWKRLGKRGGKAHLIPYLSLPLQSAWTISADSLIFGLTSQKLLGRRLFRVCVYFWLFLKTSNRHVATSHPEWYCVCTFVFLH